jgi:multidrug efflux pump subunit AcrA (membrane-fusion protein)
MVKRLILMLVVMALFIAGLGFLKFRQFQTMAGQAFTPPPEAVTTIVAKQEEWPATLSQIGTVAAVQGVTVSADLPGIVDRIEFDSGKWVKQGDVLVRLDTKQEEAQLAAAEAQRDLARLNFTRLQGLVNEERSRGPSTTRPRRNRRQPRRASGRSARRSSARLSARRSPASWASARSTSDSTSPAATPSSGCSRSTRST